MLSIDELEVRSQKILKKINISEDLFSVILGFIVVVILAGFSLNYYHQVRKLRELLPKPLLR